MQSGPGAASDPGDSISHTIREAPRNASVDVSVVVPMRNAAKYIDRCLNSLLRQTYSPARYEIIAVDNNSTDGSAGLVAKYPRVRLLAEAKPGSYAARNCGVKAAQGRILAFTDADCVAAENWLTELLAPLAAPEVAVVQGGRVFARESRALSMLAAYEAERTAYSLSPEGEGTHFGYTNNMAVRREVFDRCGPFLEIARGADSVFVDRVVKTYSIDAVRFERKAVVSHLEITGVTRWLTKKAIHGGSLQRTRRIRGYRRPRSMMLPVIVKRTIARGNYSAAGSVWLFVVVCLGRFALELGRLSWWCRTLGAKPAAEENNTNVKNVS